MRGRPILGVISGFMFGLFLAIALFLWGVIPFHSPLMWILPIVGIVLGLVMAAWAPFGRGDGSSDESAEMSDSTDTTDEHATSDVTEEE